MTERERTFILIKPDGVQRGLIGAIIRRFERKGFKLVALKFLWPTEEIFQKHYSDLSSRLFFDDLMKQMCSGPVVPMVWEGINAVKCGRQIVGATNPSEFQPNTIRGDFSIEVGRNIIYVSHSIEFAKKDISLWFNREEILKWSLAGEDWLLGVNE